MNSPQLILLFCAFLETRSSKIDLVTDRIANRNSIKLGVNLCWNHAETKELIDRNAYIQIGFLQPDFDAIYTQIVLDLIDCDSSWNLLAKFNKIDLFRTKTDFLFIVRSNQMDSICAELRKLYVNSLVTVATINGSNYKLKQIYKIKETGDLIWESYNPKPIAFRRRNLNRTELFVNYLFEDNETINYINTFRFPTVDTFAKQNYGAFNCLVDLLNFTYVFVYKKSYGYYNETTKSFDGIVQSLEENVTTLSVSSMLFTKLRLTRVDFVAKVNDQEIMFFMKKPSISYVTGIFTVAFQTRLWFALFGFVAAIIVSVAAILWYERRDACDAILVALEGICQQGTMIDPKSVSGRILFFSIFVSSMVFYFAYSCNIVVLLQSTRALGSREELLQSRLGAGAMETSYMRHYLNDPKNDETRVQLNRNKIGPHGYYSIEDGCNKVQNGSFAFHAEITSAWLYMQRKFSDDQICALQTLVGYIPVNLGYMPMQKNSPLKETVKVAMQKILEHGLHQRHYKRFVIKPECYSTTPTFVSVGALDVYQAYIVLGIGIVIAAFIFCTELIAN